MADLFGRKVDLVETPAVTNPFFLQAILPSRRVLYAAIHHPTVWGVVENDLPALKQQVAVLLTQAGTPSSGVLAKCAGE